MKKKLLYLLCVVFFVSVLFVGCSKRNEENTGDGTVEPKGVTITFDTRMEGYTVPSLFLDGTDKEMPDAPFCAGYTFLGWYYDVEYTRMFFITDGFTEDTTLYAKWRKNQATIEPGQAATQETDAGGIVYAKKEDEYFVVGYSGALPEVTVPETYKDLPVSGVKSGAFNGTIVRKINLPVSIKTIEDGAFAGAKKLIEINVVESNPSYASESGVLFNKEGTALICLPAMHGALGYNVPVAVTELAPYSLHGCNVALHFSESSNLTTITENAFAGFSGDIALPESVLYIEKYAFSGADCKVIFPANCRITALRNGAFDGYIGAKLTLPASVTEISGSAFYGCGAEIDMSLTGLTALGNSAFHGYIGKTLFIPSSVTSLGSGCFYGCTAEITFDERSDLRTVGENSFSNFAGKVTFPASVKTVERYAFYHALSGAEITFSAKRSEMAIDGTAFESCPDDVDVIFQQ